MDKQTIKEILQKFVESGWDLISIPSANYLEGNGNKADLIAAVEQANKECGSCGCELDALYKVILNNFNLINIQFIRS